MNGVGWWQRSGRDFSFHYSFLSNRDRLQRIKRVLDVWSSRSVHSVIGSAFCCLFAVRPFPFPMPMPTLIISFGVILLPLHAVVGLGHQLPSHRSADDDTDLLNVVNVPRFADFVRFSPFHYGLSLRKTHLQPQRQFGAVSVENARNSLRKLRSEGRLHSIPSMAFSDIISLIRSGRLFPSKRISVRFRPEGTQTQVDASQITNELPPLFERHYQNRQAKTLSGRPGNSFREVLLKALNQTKGGPTNKRAGDLPRERGAKKRKEGGGGGGKKADGNVEKKKAEEKFGGRGGSKTTKKRQKGVGLGERERRSVEEDEFGHFVEKLQTRE